MTHWHAQVVVRAQTYLDLKCRFLRISKDLEAVLSDPPSREDFRAWHRRWLPTYHCRQRAFDEWFLTQKLDRRVLGALWSNYYRGAAESALKHEESRFVAHLNALWQHPGVICGDPSCATCRRGASC